MAISGLTSFYLHQNHRPCPAAGRKCKYAGQSVRALPIRIITVGRKRSPGVRLLVDEYMTKLKHYCSVEDVHVRSNPKNARRCVRLFELLSVVHCHDSYRFALNLDILPGHFANCAMIYGAISRFSDVRAQVDDEDVAAMNLIRSDDWVVMLDEHGLNVGSEEMADLIGDAGNTGASRLSFCIGGPYGHGRQIRKRANISIRLSSLVLNHQIALLVLIEQLYRSWTILKGQSYNH